MHASESVHDDLSSYRGLSSVVSNQIYVSTEYGGFYFVFSFVLWRGWRDDVTYSATAAAAPSPLPVSLPSPGIPKTYKSVCYPLSPGKWLIV